MFAPSTEPSLENCRQPPIGEGLAQTPANGAIIITTSQGRRVDRFGRPPRADFAVGGPNNDDDDEGVSDRTELVRPLGSKLVAAIEIETDGGRRGERLAAAVVSPSWF